MQNITFVFLAGFLAVVACSGGKVGSIGSTSSSDEWILGGGHFDTWPNCPGADRNASGTTLWITVAKYLSRYPQRSKNLMFAAFDQEEQGIVGRAAMAQWLKNDRKLSVHSVHVADTIGWDADGDRVVHIDRSIAPWYQETNKLLNLGMNFPSYSVREKRGFTSDAAAYLAEQLPDPFRDAGFRAGTMMEELSLGDGTPHYLCQNGTLDSYETVYFDYLAMATRLAIHTFMDLVK